MNHRVPIYLAAQFLTVTASVLLVCVWLRPGIAGETALTRLTHDADPEFYPQWSPDGTQILYDGGMVLNIADGTKILVAPGASPAWSPDGSKIASILDKDGYSIWIYPSTGGTPAPLSAPGSFWGPRWSPDGNLIAALREVGSLPVQRLSLVAISGGAVTDLWVPLGNFGCCPSWSPDGQNLAIPYQDEAVMNLWKVPISGDSPSRLTSLDDNATSSAWSPDGQHIAFASGGRVWTIPAAGGEPIPVTDISTDFQVDWSPDGTSLVFVSERGGTTDLWLTDAVTPARPSTWGGIKRLYGSGRP